ncbi:biotin-protein ligase [Mucor mucedo]|uniref:biotin-protein ligase n=1 Tax=Mucor mucedo TaxID=29922 RepID=UPI00221F0A5A|nr:biotin-protein ligase [Mucor mucedo]KAI7888897.1 biotin-protein ligase [Mucor mucedo]
MNVLIYNGNGTSPNSVKQAYLTLKAILGHAYDVMKVDAATLKTEPWEETCSLLVIPGGRDQPYCEDLNGRGNQKIRRYVSEGGHYLGFCAGGYYASKEIEFEKGHGTSEIIGSRELAFFPGVCRGTMFPGFIYNSEKGARSVGIVSNNKTIKTYYNGGGYFANAKSAENVKVICTYQDSGLCGDQEDEPAAGIKCQVGKGSALLFGVHPEYDVSLVDLTENEEKEKITAELTASLPFCRDLLCQSLSELGLNVLQAASNVPDLTPIYMSAINGNTLNAITAKLLTKVDGNNILKDSNDTFCISEINHVDALKLAMEKLSIERRSEDKSPVLQVLYPATSSTQSLEPVVPDKSLTPVFDLSVFYKSLLDCRKLEWGGGSWYRLGNAMLCSEVITSTQTVLDKNYEFAQNLPSGLVCLATNQIAGRGRGRNSWVSQAGALQFSFIIRHSLKLDKSPVVFIQYLTALAIVESIRGRKGYEDVPLRVKWPNDIYVDLPNQGLKKVGGLIVNSSFIRDEFLLVIGCGVNLNNTHPTVSINDVIKNHNPSLKKLDKEDVLAHVLVTFEKLYIDFCEKGMGKWFLDLYYSRWLHSNKLVTLTTHDNERAKIVGITSDYGMLEAVSVDDPRKKFTLQPDGNSFDMLKGLIIKKT